MPTLVFLLLSLLVIVGCSGSEVRVASETSAFQTVDTKPEPALPSTEGDLWALLPSASPEERFAIKGRLRELQGTAQLSFRRVAVVGASLSAGFGGLTLDTALGSGIAGDHKIIDVSSILFFKSPYENGRQQIDQAIGADATVVFALDILFWYVYVNAGLDQRLASLDEALKNLERVSAPIILGDIPDMRTGQPWMLPLDVIPSPEHLASLNARLHEWARGRLNVHVVPLAAWSKTLIAGGDLVVEPGKPPVAAKSLIHVDGLHPNPQGVRYMLMRLDPSLEIAFPNTKAEALAF